MQDKIEQNRKVSKYLKKTAIKRILNPGRPTEIYDAFIAYMTELFENEKHNEKSLNAFVTLLTQESSRIDAIFEEQGAARFLRMILPDDTAKKVEKIWERSVEYPYSTGYNRRPFRTRVATQLHLGLCIRYLMLFVMMQAQEIELEDLLTGKQVWDLKMTANLIALEIDEGNEKLFGQVREIVGGQAAEGTITRGILLGLLMCHDDRAHKLAGDLFLAAKLQEGLRQAVVECMDEGCRQSFLYLLHIILDNDMLRFSSVVRALDVWTGLGIQAEKPSVVKKCLEAGLSCLEDKNKIEEYTNGTDSMQIYMGLWAAAFDEANDLVALFPKLLGSGERHKRLCALYFLRQTQLSNFQRRIAESLLNDGDVEVLAWAVDNMYTEQSVPRYRYGFQIGEESVRGQADESAAHTFSSLLPLAKRLPPKEHVFKESVFLWGNVALSSSIVLEKMMIAILGCANDEQIDALAGLIDKMDADIRHSFVMCFLQSASTPLQKETVVKAMGDKSSHVRRAASDIIAKLSLSDEDYLVIEDLLVYKSGDLRKNAMSVLLKMSTEDLIGCIGRLSQSGNENKRLAAIELAHAMEKDTRHTKHDITEKALVSDLPAATQKERMHSEKLAQSGPMKRTKAHGFGLFDPETHYVPPAFAPASSGAIKRIMFSHKKQAKALLQDLADAFEKHKEYEYEIETWNGAKERRLLGDEWWSHSMFGWTRNGSTLRLEDLPLSDVWIDIFKRYLPEQILFLRLSLQSDISFGNKNSQWYTELMDSVLPTAVFREIQAFITRLPYTSNIDGLTKNFEKALGQEETFEIASEVCRYLYENIPVDRFSEQYREMTAGHYFYGNPEQNLVDSAYLKFWLVTLRSAVHDDSSFTEYFNIAYGFYAASQFKSCPLMLSDFGRAMHLGIIDEKETLAQLLGRPTSPGMIAVATNRRRHAHEQAIIWPELMDCVEKAVNCIVRTETWRGELPTEVSALAANVKNCKGMEHFVSILLNAENDTYVRGYDFIGDDSTKRNMLSHLLRCLYPLPGEDERTLRTLLQGKRVLETQLIDAAMYSPQWIELVEKYLGWEGLKSACWYFHAHVNNVFNEEKTAVVARFSPIEPHDFKDGAFDINWFWDAFNTLGPVRFQTVYDSAKYIAGGNLHRRSQLFADAVTGKLDLLEMEKQVESARNKDRLLAYSLIPQGGKEDLLRRYRFIQRYAKQAKQFGAQRQAAETRAAKIALENLARNAGYTDANRLMWSMETEELDELTGYFTPKEVDDICVCVAMDEKGNPSLLIQKDGKELKDVPARLRKNEYLEAAKAVVKQLKEQHQRARASLEAAMVNEDSFTPGELSALERNPVLSPMLHTLVFRCGDRFGLYSAGNLTDTAGVAWALGSANTLEIAHPVNFHTCGVWADWQKFLFDRQIVQPFRQVFRELYVPNQDELFEGTLSRRYAGHQVQPKKTLALLKTKGWTASPEEGLQKVQHKRNIIVEILAMADWFSPAEVENPTIEIVRFINRKTGEPIQIAALSPVMFSEAMRDVDLAVSVAHAGGVDPEASLSTVEMRSVIIANLLPLLCLSNVRLQGSHALIAGNFGDYSVHLGSGVVHMMARGAINILPVHSQHRRRIFLPFVDEDPKTAEIVSKIVLLAEDKKIKDPSILEQIKI